MYRVVWVDGDTLCHGQVTEMRNTTRVINEIEEEGWSFVSLAPAGGGVYLTFVSED